MGIVQVEDQDLQALYTATREMYREDIAPIHRLRAGDNPDAQSLIEARWVKMMPYMEIHMACELRMEDLVATDEA